MGLGDGRGLGLGRGHGYGYGRGLGHGRGAFSGYSCVKIVFFGFNVIFWLLGCAVLGIGIWLQVVKGQYASLAPSVNFLSATVICIAAGVLILIIGFFGCCGAIMENQCMLLTYFIFVIIIFILEIVVSVLAFVYRNEIEHTAKKELLDGIRTKWLPHSEDKNEEGLTDGWAYIQSTMHCCGVNNYTDWFKISAWPESDHVPPECCKDNATNCDTTGHRPEHYYQNGCLNSVKHILMDNLYIVGITCICIILIQILGMTAAMIMFCCLRGDKYYDE